MRISAIAAYEPQTVEEQQVKEKMLNVASEKDIFTRENTTHHFTSSALIISEDKKEVLLIHHNIYNAWGWTGGHNDGEVDFRKVALKEAQEETGIEDFTWFSSDIQSLDSLPVAAHTKNGQQIAAHQHLNVAYILMAKREAVLKLNNEETSGLRWWPLNDLLAVSQEPLMAPVYKKLLKRINMDTDAM